MKQRFAVLDGLRGIAAMAVAAYHAGVFLHLRGALTIKGDPAVDLFFCISGFVLAYAHDKNIVEGRLIPTKFLVARWLRFLPILVLGSCLGFAAIQFNPDSSPFAGANDVLPASSEAFALSLFLIPIFFKSQFVFVNGVFWSLCIELIVNFLYAFEGNRLKPGCLYAIWLTSAVALVGFLVWYRTIHFPGDPLGATGCLTRGIVSFFAGVVVFRIWQSGFRAPPMNPWIPVGVMCIPLLFPYSAAWFQAPFDGFFILIVFPVVVWVAASSTASVPEIFPIIGEASFSLYAIHLPILMFLYKPFVELSTPIKLIFVACFTILTTIVAILVAKLYEQPARVRIREIVRRLQPKTEG